MEFASKETTNSHCKYSSESSPKDLWPFIRVPVHLTKEKTQIFQPLNTGSELTLISRNQNITGQVIDGVLHQFQITVGPPGLWTYLTVIAQFLSVSLE